MLVLEQVLVEVFENKQLTALVLALVLDLKKIKELVLGLLEIFKQLTKQVMEPEQELAKLLEPLVHFSKERPK